MFWSQAASKKVSICSQATIQCSFLLNIAAKPLHTVLSQYLAPPITAFAISILTSGKFMAQPETFLKELDKKLWTAADKLRSNLDAAVYKHAVRGLIFLKYVSDSFELRQNEVEKENPKLKGVLNKNCTQLQLPFESLINLIAKISFQHDRLNAKDILGHVYEYFLGQFALAEGKKGGQYYTPKSIANLIVEMFEPFKGRAYA